jgi:DHA2 family multidrug resistance protein
MGFGLIATGLGCLQLVLDKGQEDDWFGSTFITTFAILAGVCLVLCVVRELTVDEPVVDLPLLKDGNFLLSNLLMFALGFILFGTTQLIPQFVQDLLGYTATDAGLVISPGGFMVMAMMPVVGILVSRVQPKYLILVGFMATAASLWHMTDFNTQITYGHAAMARVYQAAGIAFLFVPINTIAYAGLPKGKSNNASALLNLSRNLGGSVGISIANTMISRRGQFHISRLTEHLNLMNPMYRRFTQNFGNRMGGAAAGTQRAAGTLYSTINKQATMLSYLDVFWFMCISSLFVCILVLFLRKVKPHEKHTGGH